MRSLYETPAGKIERDLDEKSVRLALGSKQGVLWLDFEHLEEAGAAYLREVFDFHHLALEDCTNGHVDTPKIDDYGRYLFIVAQSIAGEIGERLQLAETDIFLGPNYVVSAHDEPSTLIDDLFERVIEGAHSLSRGADFLAHSILDVLVDQLLPVVEAMDEELDGLESRILERPESSLLQQLLLVKRQALRLRRATLPQRDLVNRISRGEYGNLIDNEALIFYRDIYDHIVRVDEMLEGLRDLADSALSSYLSAVNNRMNEVMKALSVVAAVFLPLTLVASIFGTNLNYSEFGLHFKYGFLLMIGFMALIAISLVAYFKRRGWL